VEVFALCLQARVGVEKYGLIAGVGVMRVTSDLHVVKAKSQLPVIALYFFKRQLREALDVV